MPFNILVVEDDNNQRQVLTGFLKKKGFDVFDTGEPEKALKITREKRIDAVLSDLRMPGMTGLELLIEIKKINPEIAVLILTAYGSVETAVDSMKDGAFDFLTKPVNLDHLLKKLNQIINYQSLQKENKDLKQALEKNETFSSFITHAAKMESILSVASRAAASTASILLLGESGTGKELIARAIHQASSRRSNSFIAVNCAALAEGVLESELFGHEKGAFTGATARRLGRFEQAHNGTLFLDEVGDIPAGIQIKLLRTIQEGTLERVGGNETIKVDVRLIAATHQDLLQQIKNGVFREDLYYRLNVVNINIPPLRERREDIPALIDRFLDNYAKKYKREALELSPEARDILMKHEFPGNVRELQNILERAVVLCRGSVIDVQDLNLEGIQETVEATEPQGGHLDKMLADLEIREIRNALENSGGNQSQAARALGIGERKLRYKLQKYGIDENKIKD